MTMGEETYEYMVMLKTGEKICGNWLEITGEEVLLKREDYGYELFLFPQIASIYRLGERVAI